MLAIGVGSRLETHPRGVEGRGRNSPASMQAQLTSFQVLVLLAFWAASTAA